MHILPLLLLSGCVSAAYSMASKLWIKDSFRYLNREWVTWLRGPSPNYDEPVFWNVHPKHYFYENTTMGWVAGVTVSPEPMFPFLKDLGEKMCDRSRQKLKSPCDDLTYKLKIDSIGSDFKSKPKIAAISMRKEGDNLQLCSTGYWWAGLFRNGHLLYSTTSTPDDSGELTNYSKKNAFTALWPVDSNDLLVVTNGDYGEKNEDLISIAVETGEEYAVLLQQMARNLQPSLKVADSTDVKNLLVMVRMVPSEEQVLEL